MRDLKRNQQIIWCALLNKAADTDEWGNTQDVKTYGEPFQLNMSISANKGEASAQAFGTELQYDREMSTHDMSCPIDEYAILWVGGKDVSEPHNYIVEAVSPSLNCIRYAIRRVNVS